MSDSVKAAIRYYFDTEHIRASVFFARGALRAEGSPHSESERGRALSESISFAIGTVISAVCFLEATINEFFLDATSGTLARAWRDGIERWPVLSKYQWALALSGKEMLDQGRRPFQDAQYLVDLRNYLVHYRPAEVLVLDTSEEERTGSKLEQRHNGRFPLNRLARAGEPFFPKQVLGAGCARWAVESSLDFTDTFFHELGVSARYGAIRSELTL